MEILKKNFELETKSFHSNGELSTFRSRISKVEDMCCNAQHFVEEQGYVTCQNCGTVFERILDLNPRRAFTQEEVSKRKNTEPVYSPFGPRTVIRGNADAKGTVLSMKDQSKFQRLSKIHRSLTSSYERNLWMALPNFQRMQERLGLPEAVTEEALRIYTHAVKEKLTMGRSIDTLLAASIYVSLKIHGNPRTIEEILKISETPKKALVKTYRLILMKILPKLNIRVAHLGPTRFVDKFIEELKMPMEIRHLAVELINTGKKNGMLIEGKDPKGLAAAAIYISARKKNFPRTQIEIAKLSRVTEVTLRMRAKDLMKYNKLPYI